MNPTKEKIVAILKNIIDPKTGQNIVAVNRVHDIRIERNVVQFALAIPNLTETEKQSLNFECMGKIMEVYPQAMVHVHMVNPNQNNPKAGGGTLPQVRNIIAVASGKGGVGKSTVSVNLALGLKALGAKVGIIDADLYGPSIPTMFGLQGQRPKVTNVHGRNKIIPLEAHGMPIMSIGFIVEPEQAVVLRGPRLAAIVKQFINDCLWPELDYLVIDLPPGTGDIQLTLVQTVPITGAVMVTTPQEVALADAIKAMNMFLLQNVNVPILGVVENMSWFTPAELPNNKYHIFGKGGGKKLAKLSESMLLGQIPIVQSIREAGDKGVPAILQDEAITKEAFMTVAKNTLRQVMIRNEYLEPTRIVKMKN